MNKKQISLTILCTIFLVPYFFLAGLAYADIEGQNQTFNTNEAFDKLSRKSISATLRHIGKNAYFYIEDKYWDSLGFRDKEDLLNGVKTLADEFDSNVYPKETSFWGQEPKPGVDNDDRMVILLEQLQSGNGGYFSTSNGYPKSRYSESNEREMITVNVESVPSPYTKIFLAHELQHLISFNQKEILRGIQEDVWLNELRSEYAVTVAGYNDTFLSSNLEQRANKFFTSPSDSLTEWPNVSQDYVVVALFAEYIAEQHGRDLLKDTLQNNSFGIYSINNFLTSSGDSDRFIKLFSTWLAASYINDSSINSKFSYSKPGLKNYKASLQQITTLSGSISDIYDYTLKPWQVYGHKFFVSGSLFGDKILKLSPAYGSKFAYADNLGRFAILDSDFYVNDPGSLQYFFVFPVNDKKLSDFRASEESSVLTLAVKTEDKSLGADFGSVLKNGALIKKARESEVYVIEGKYKRYLRPEIISLYGHLIGVKPIEVSDGIFNSYTTTNYVRYVNGEKVYAVWPDGTKHWLNITPQQWDISGRDWNAIFVINDLELNTYKIGSDIIR